VWTKPAAVQDTECISTVVLGLGMFENGMFENLNESFGFERDKPLLGSSGASIGFDDALVWK